MVLAGGVIDWGSIRTIDWDASRLCGNIRPRKSFRNTPVDHSSVRLTANMTKRTLIGIALCRIVVPLWVLAGAAFKLYERTPSNLPSGMLAVAKGAGTDLNLLLRLLIGLEFFAVGVMFFVPRLARAMAIFMLTCFCSILIWELIRSATKCGCFGSITIKPWQMLTIDGTLLLLTVVFNPNTGKPAGEPSQRQSFAMPAFASAVLLAIGLAIAFGVPDRAPTIQRVIDDQTPTTAHATPPTTQASTSTQPDVIAIQRVTASLPADPTVNPNPLPIPNSWYTKVPTDQWMGKPWRDLEIFQLMPRWPKDMDKGKRYVVFYSRTCEHCQAMFWDDLIVPLDAPITAVEIPQSKDVLTALDAWAMPPAEHVELLALPLGCNWIIQPPLAVVLQDGIVTCANEGDHKACFNLQ